MSDWGGSKVGHLGYNQGGYICFKHTGSNVITAHEIYVYYNHAILSANDIELATLRGEGYPHDFGNGSLSNESVGPTLFPADTVPLPAVHTVKAGTSVDENLW